VASFIVWGNPVGGLRWQYCAVLVQAPTVAHPASRGWPVWARATAAALAMHALVLSGWGVETGPTKGQSAPREARVPAVTIRTLELTRARPSPVPDPPTPPAAAASPPPARVAVPAPPRPAVAMAAAPAMTSLPANDPALAATAVRHEPDEGTPPPVYRTRLPPPFVWHYVVQRGARSGQSDLRFVRDEQAYEIGWSSRWPGREELGLASRGGVDEAGLAPERFADRRRGHERQAANFDRSGGRITYSGPQVEHALLAGAQDRVSWMVQLPAIIDADPAAFGAAGARVQLQVTGARGDAGVWTFVVKGREDLALPAGPVPGTLHLVREALRPYDTRVEVWLDATRHHLPVRVRLTPVPAGEPLELQLDHPPAPPQ
jgi:hypothetical protein